MTTPTQPAEAIILKTCCANLYKSDWARLLLGDSFHPGGLALTERLGTLLELGPGRRVLDVAAGKGTSAIHLAQRFGCEVVGMDYGAQSVAESIAAAASAGMADRIRFKHGDAESLPFTAGEFDALICECAFCTFPDKRAAVSEFARVLKPGGRVGLSDLTRSGPLPRELDSLLAWVACIADARPAEEYTAYLQSVGFSVEHIEPHNHALAEMVTNIRTKLLGAELMVKLKKIELPGVDFEQVKGMARSALEAVRQGKLGYAIIVGAKTSGSSPDIRQAPGKVASSVMGAKINE
jgi:ubiquinone/menaquinone biosynthesis C-methylase UbiE